MNSFSKIINKTWWWTCYKSCAIINCDMVLVVSSPFLPMFLTSSVIGTEKVLHLSLFSPRQLNSSLNSFAKTFMIKW